MKLLIVIPYVPNLIRVRPYQIIRALHRQGHEITLATLWSNEEELSDIRTLEAMGITVVAEELTRIRSLWNTLRTIPSRRPLQTDYCWHPRLAKRIKTLLATTHFDAVHVEHLRGALYGLDVQKALAGAHSNGNGSNGLNGHDSTGSSNRQNSNRQSSNRQSSNGQSSVPVVWDSVDCISHLFEQASTQSRSLKGRLMTRLDLRRTRLFEGYLVNQFGQIVTTSQADADALANLAKRSSRTARNGHLTNGNTPNGLPTPEIRSKILALPNGVDLDYFQSNDGQTVEGQRLVELAANGSNGSSQPTIVFSGKMSYHANVTAALYLVDEIMPLVWAQQPDVQVQIVGKDPGTEIRSLVEKHGLVEDHSLAENQRPKVMVTGTVPDLRPYLSSATVAVAPVPYGAGIQNKVLEAMACGAPVIASVQAASGVAARPGADLLVADSPEGFAQAILTLLNDPALRTSIAKAGRAYVENHHSWDSVSEKLVELYSRGK